jgi:G3E family GTPase
MSDTQPTPIPVTILSGFLGSGKTTLLNVLLRAPHGLRLAVIVNEFGAVGIDGALVPQGETFVELDNGCLCCALNEDLVSTMEQLVAKGGIDHIVIETTGLADPLPVAWTCTRPSVSAALRVDAIVTVVDARAIGAALIDSLEARMQVNRADVVVLNKLDLVPDGGAQAQEHIRAHNGQAPMLHAVQGRVPWPLVLGHGANAPARAVLETAPGAEHGHGHGSARYQTYSYTLPADRAVDEAAVEALTYRVPEAVFRFKGLLRVDSPEGPWLLVNGVAGRIDLRFLTPEPAPKVSAMVFIGRALNAPALQALCAEALSMDS